MKVCILLAVYNGSAYLPALLDSLLEQSEQDFIILAQDDGSNDNSLNILADYAARFNGRLHILHNTSLHHGAKANFMLLAQAALKIQADYFMFCDQDDVWLPDKIAVSLELAQQIQAAESSVPLLVHTDLTTVDQDLNILAPSFIQQEKIDVTADLRHLLLQNNATGCTFLFNRALLEKAADWNHLEAIKMHDWWFALTAALLGEVQFLDQPTILYRQHGSNSIGAASSLSLKELKNKIKKNLVPLDKRDFYRMVDEFYLSFQNELKPADQKLMQEYLDLPQKSKLVRMGFMLRNRIRTQNRLTTWFKILTI